MLFHPVIQICRRVPAWFQNLSHGFWVWVLVVIMMWHNDDSLVVIMMWHNDDSLVVIMMWHNDDSLGQMGGNLN